MKGSRRPHKAVNIRKQGSWATLESVCHWVWSYCLLFQLVLSHQALFQLKGHFLCWNFFFNSWRHRFKKTSSGEDLAWLLPITSGKRKSRTCWNQLLILGFLWTTQAARIQISNASKSQNVFTNSQERFSPLKSNNIVTSIFSCLIFLYNGFLQVYSFTKMELFGL